MAPFLGRSPAQSIPTTQDVSGHIQQLIEALGHADPLERERAEKALIAAGPLARSAVRAAMSSDDPEIASRASSVFLRLPWALPGDSVSAREQLAAYGKADDRGRAVIISTLAQRHEIAVLMRLLEEEPLNGVRWHIAGVLSDDDYKDLELDRRLKEVSPDDDNAPLLFLAAERSGYADRGRTLALYRRVIELESQALAPSQPALSRAYEVQVTEAARSRDVATMARLLRRQSNELGPTSLGHNAVARLFTVHAYLGAQPGLSQDVRAFGATVGRPVFADRVTALFELAALPPPSLLATWAHIAADAPPEIRLWAGLFLTQQRMPEPAEFELAVCLARIEAPDEAERGAPPSYDYERVASFAHEMLSRHVGERGDDAAAAAPLRKAVELRGDQPLRRKVVRVPPGAVEDPVRDMQQAEIHWRELRAARSVGDQAKLREHLDALKVLNPSNTDIILDLVPLLKETGQPEAARRIFDAAYKVLRAAVDEDPQHPEPMNNLAWLCARSGERLDEALQLATRAVALDPDNAAYLDTAAEANFRVGNVDEAIRLETRGVELRPTDKFMREQLERFKAAKKSG